MDKIAMIIEFDSALISIFVLAFLLIERAYKEKEYHIYILTLLSNLIYLGCDCIIKFNRLYPSVLIKKYIKVFVMGVGILPYIIIVLVGELFFFHYSVKKRRDESKWVHAMYTMCVFGVAGVLSSPFTKLYYYYDEQNVYHQGWGYYFLVGLCIAMLLLMGYRAYIRRHYFEKEQLGNIAVTVMIPFAGIVAQLLTGYYWISLSFAICIFVIMLRILVGMSTKYIHQRHLILQSRTYLLSSQIKPHFVFNSLTVIKVLIKKDPQIAKDAIEQFSRYLEKSLSVERISSTVPLSNEMEFVDSYLYLEKLRFEDKLHVKYDIEEGLDFEIPFLTIQPLVENAVKHGIRQKEEAGTLTIQIRKKQKFYEIRIIDDGVGFDREKQLKDSRLNKKGQSDHGVGLQNVEERLWLLCHGTIGFESEIGKGTTATIQIPIDGAKEMETIRGLKRTVWK